MAVILMVSAMAQAQPQPPVPPQTPAAPQTPAPPQAPRPFSGLFRGAPTAPQDNASVLVSGYGGYDNDRSAQGEQGAGGGVAGDGPYTGVDVDLSYTPGQRGRVSFDARGTTSLRYYTNLSDVVAASQTASAGASFRFSRRVTLQTRGGVACTPYFDYTDLPGMEEPPPGPDVEVPPRIPDNTETSRRVLSYDAGADLTHALSDRTSYSFRYSGRVTETLDEGQRSVDNILSAGFNHRLNRRTTGRVTYAHREGRYDTGLIDRPVSVDDVEFGFDRDWARSPTRRTVFSFTVGPSIISQADQRFYRGLGGVALTHPFARSWSLRALYRRGVQFVDGSARPYFSDSGTFALSGLITRRVDVSGSIGAVLGDLGLEGTTTPYDTYSASARFRYGMTRTLAMYGEYLYNYSTYSDSAGMPSLNRSSLRFGVSLYVPLQQERTPRRGQ
jgi:hypothetical protein